MLRYHRTQEIKFAPQHWRGNAQHNLNTNFNLILSRVVRMLRPWSCPLIHEAHHHISSSVGVPISTHWSLVWLPCLNKVSRMGHTPNNIHTQSGCTSKNFLMQRRRPPRNSHMQRRRRATKAPQAKRIMPYAAGLCTYANPRHYLISSRFHTFYRSGLWVHAES